MVGGRGSVGMAVEEALAAAVVSPQAGVEGGLEMHDDDEAAGGVPACGFFGEVAGDRRQVRPVEEDDLLVGEVPEVEVAVLPVERQALRGGVAFVRRLAACFLIGVVKGSRGDDRIGQPADGGGEGAFAGVGQAGEDEQDGLCGDERLVKDSLLGPAREPVGDLEQGVGLAAGGWCFHVCIRIARADGVGAGILYRRRRPLVVKSGQSERAVSLAPDTPPEAALTAPRQ